MEQNLQNIESIFDFFYLDQTKIKSFYAQLSGTGALETYKSFAQKTDNRTLEAGLSIPATAHGKTTTSHTANSSNESVFDGKPTMPREMINRLDELGFIHRELNNDLLGSLVLLEGRLGVLDVSLTKTFLKNFQSNIIKERRLNQKNKKEIIETIKFIQDLPFSLEARLIVPDGEFDQEQKKQPAHEVWMTLNRNELVGEPHDLNFKHGLYLTGQWYVLGILDALPFDNINFDTDKTEIREMIEQGITTMRELIGRPQTAFGITPIAIFRVLKKNKS